MATNGDPAGIRPKSLPARGAWIEINNKRGEHMNNQLNQALASAAASSAMEGMPLSAQDLSVVKQILEGSLTLADYFTTIQRKHQEA